ncbi:hypothetical protein KSS87_008314 [Heliosperma pusillum]|nr:hypothetical protein KSS87_008314 [Heliosperma pusillum]
MDYEPCPSDNSDLGAGGRNATVVDTDSGVDGDGGGKEGASWVVVVVIVHDSDTDEGLAAHQNRHQRAPHISGNGNAMLSSGPYRRVQGDMEHQIHHLEKEAYCAVLRAFKAQSDAISWEKEGLITELRKELRVSDDEHRELLVSVNNDDTIRRIREWRQAGGHLIASHPNNDVPSPTAPSSRKKPRTLQPLPPHVTPIPPAPTGPAVASRGRKPRQFPYNSQVAHETPIPGSGDQLIGRKVLTRWPDDNHFYEAVITRYNPSDGRHALVYGMNTPEESFEWVNIMEIPSEDIRWVNEDPGLSRRGGPGERSVGAVPGAGRKKPRNEQQNGAANMDDIEILHTDTLIKEVEKVVAARNPDRLDIEKAKKMLKDHEQALMDVITRLNYISDGDSGNRLIPQLCYIAAFSDIFSSSYNFVSIPLNQMVIDFSKACGLEDGIIEANNDQPPANRCTYAICSKVRKLQDTRCIIEALWKCASYSVIVSIDLSFASVLVTGLAVCFPTDNFPTCQSRNLNMPEGFDASQMKFYTKSNEGFLRQFYRMHPAFKVAKSTLSDEEHNHHSSKKHTLLDEEHNHHSSKKPGTLSDLTSNTQFGPHGL